MDLTKREKIGLLVFSFVIITFLSILYYNGKSKPVEVVKKSEVKNETPESSKNGEIMVQIVGEVNRPGVYTLKTDDRLKKLIELAGGTTANADEAAINGARKLKDEDMVVIPARGGFSPAGSPLGSQRTSVSNGMVNINTATLEELKTLDGIGDTLAQRIIDYRTSNGLFGDIKDIRKVSGIGESRYKAIENKISVH